jgi:O-antigen/teichoic acid export membrane protein
VTHYLVAVTSTASADRTRDNRGTWAIVIATAGSAIAVLVFQALASRTLGTDGFAPIAVMWTVMFLLFTVLQLPAEQHLTRALVVTRDHDDLRRVYRAMLGAFGLALLVGVGFTWVTLDRFFEGNMAYVAITGAIVVARSIMTTARGSLAGHRRFSGYGATIAFEAVVLLVGGIIVAAVDGSAPMFAVIMVLAPLATLLTRPFSPVEGHGGKPNTEPQPASFLAWLILATAASQMIIAGGPIAVSFIGGSTAAVSIFFTSFALLRGPITSAYNLVARVLPDFTELANSNDPQRLWKWGPKLVVFGFVVAVVGAIGAGLLLRPFVGAIYGESFRPPQLAAVLGGASIGLGLGALFATQMYTAAAKGPRLATGWLIALLASVSFLMLSSLEPITRTAAAFGVGEGTGLLLLGLVLVERSHRSTVTEV